MEALLLRSTYFPEDRLTERRWLRYIAGRDLNLDEIDSDSLIGAVIKESYQKDPEGTVKFIKESAEDNRDMIIQVIGQKNFDKIF